jgi:hypothetical protein
MILFGVSIVTNLISLKMAKVKVKESKSPKYFTITIVVAIVFGVIIVGGNKMKIMGENTDSSESSGSNSEQIERIFSKDYNLRTFEEWKQIADYRAQEYYECMKHSNLSDTYTNESCSISYNNNWVDFRDSLEEKSNLSYDQQQALEDFWHKTRDAMTEKVIVLMEENDKKKRPNFYK